MSNHVFTKTVIEISYSDGIMSFNSIEEAENWVIFGVYNVLDTVNSSYRPAEAFLKMSDHVLEIIKIKTELDNLKKDM